MPPRTVINNARGSGVARKVVRALHRERVGAGAGLEAAGVDEVFAGHGWREEKPRIQTVSAVVNIRIPRGVEDQPSLAVIDIANQWIAEASLNGVRLLYLHNTPGLI